MTRRAPRRPLADRFWEKTEADPSTGCRIWQGATSAAGTGLMLDAHGQLCPATHIAVELATGSPPAKGSHVRPACGNADCVAAEHLVVKPPHGRGAKRKTKSPAERLAAKAVPDADGCLIWTGHTDLHGYGDISVNGRPVSVHRLAWSLANGRPVPAGMEVCHSCDKPLCILPAHLKAATPEENRQDRRNHGRSARGKNLAPQMKAADRAHLLATKEAGYTLEAIAGGWALNVRSVVQALALARRERAAAGMSEVA